MMILKGPGSTGSPLPDSAPLLVTLSQEGVAAEADDTSPTAPRRRRSGRANQNQDKASGSKPPPAPTRPAEGELVGADAAPLAAESMGSRLLLAMGWAPGSGIGRNNDGIAEPIQAVFRSSKKGLGF